VNTFTLDLQAFGSAVSLGVWAVSTNGNVAVIVIGVDIPNILVAGTVDIPVVDMGRKVMDPKEATENIVNPMKFNEKADAYLDALYKSVGAVTPEQQFNTLLLKLGVEHQFIGFSHNPTWEQKVAMLEYDILEREGLIEMVYV
jgi:hypothetical protein